MWAMRHYGVQIRGQIGVFEVGRAATWGSLDVLLLISCQVPEKTRKCAQ
jgi:hypothetical protein